MTAVTGNPPWAMAAEGIGLQDSEETQYVSRARTGDADAIRWLLGRYRPRAVRLAAHILRQRPEEAEDIAQEAFVRAFRSLPQLRGDGGYGPWLYRIVVRLCLDRQRRAHWNREVSPETKPVETAAFDLPAGDAVDTRLLVTMLLDRLTPPLRAALVLREIEGLEYDEIAQTLGVPVGTVRSRLHSARAQFRALWTDALEDDTHV
jgi:RNA polymerase sigma-70 factor (ECF subfamily)